MLNEYRQFVSQHFHFFIIGIKHEQISVRKPFRQMQSPFKVEIMLLQRLKNEKDYDQFKATMERIVGKAVDESRKAEKRQK